MKKLEQWSGTYRGISYTIKTWNIESIGKCWAYYLNINVQQIPEWDIWLDEVEFGRHASYDYYNSPLSNLDWHGGITYYEKSGGYADFGHRGVTVGCDYQHLWDEHRSFDENILQADAMACIDSLWEQTKVLIWCSGCGEYFDMKPDSRCDECEKKYGGSDEN
jgi:hypothetical protein